MDDGLNEIHVCDWSKIFYSSMTNIPEASISYVINTGECTALRHSRCESLD